MAVSTAVEGMKGSILEYFGVMLNVGVVYVICGSCELVVCEVWLWFSGRFSLDIEFAWLGLSGVYSMLKSSRLWV